MTDSDKTEFHRAMTKLGGIFRVGVSPEQVEGYWEAMKHFDLPVVMWAFQSAAQECQFFPKPVELRSFASTPDRPADDEDTFACLICMDRGVKLTERHNREGRSVGVFACPCSCAKGERIRSGWEKPDAKGHVVADVAKANTAKLRRMGAL